MTTTERTVLATRLHAVLDEKSLLKHPFYQKWTEGTLEAERFQEYARQYYHFESAFPRFLSAIHARTESAPVRQLILENLWDEEYGERNHVALWLEFAEALGVSSEEAKASTPNAQTAALVQHFQRVSTEAPVAEALGALFAYEGQVPRVAHEKIAGLRDRYGFAPEQYDFFTVHEQADVAHSGAELAAIESETLDDDAVVAAVVEACDILNGFLDGCYAVIED